MKKSDYPKFIWLNGTSMRILQPNDYDYMKDQVGYYRDAGRWHTYVTEKDGKLYADIPFIDYLHGKELKPCTEQDYKVTNQGYL